MGKPYSCAQFIKSKSRENPYQVLQVTCAASERAMKSNSHTRNNTDGNKLVIFSGIALFYGDNYIIIRAFDFIARSDAAHVTCSTDSRVTCST